MADSSVCEECLPEEASQISEEKTTWRLRAEPTPKWIRAKVGDKWLVDSKEALKHARNPHARIDTIMKRWMLCW